MRFVEPKTEGQQSRAIVFRTREQLVNQRTELVNALRAHLYEFGYVAPQGIGHLWRLAEIVEDESTELPVLVRDICRDIPDQIDQFEHSARGIEEEDRRAVQGSFDFSTLANHVGPITALAIETFPPPMQTFKCGRDFAAWLGPVPRQKSTGGKQR